MRTPEQVRRDVVQQWLDSARNDLSLAEIALQTPGYEGWSQIGFHAQQAVEKLLKALLVAHGVHPPDTHSIVELRARLRLIDSETADAVQDSDHLTPYAVRYRYPPRRQQDIHTQRGSEVAHAVRVARTACDVIEAAISPLQP